MGKVPAVYEGLADVAPQRLAAGRLAPRHRHWLVEQGVVGPRPLGAFSQLSERFRVVLGSQRRHGLRIT